MQKFLALCLFSSLTPSAYSLSCEDFKGLEDVSDYFEQAEDDNIKDGPYQMKLLRKSVAAFHGDLSEDVSDEEADEKGEGVSFSLVRGKDGKEYQSVNVGFGGGNGATYYYQPGTLKLAPVMNQDGECIDQGTQVEFPFETIPTKTQIYKVTCNNSDDSGLVEEVELSFPLTDKGEVFTNKGEFSATKLNVLLEGLVFSVPAKEKNAEFSIGKSKGAYTFNSSVSTKGKKEKKNWTAEIYANVKGNQAKVHGRVYPNVTGGYWSKEAKEFKSNFECDGSIPAKATKYQRVIKY